jgi:peptide subunit release factor 1 (eRF1)
MLSWKELEQLERFDSAGARVLSLSLNLDPARQATRSYRIAFKSLVKELSATLTEAERADLAREAQRVTEWFDQWEPQALGLILFSCTPRDLWLTYSVHPTVQDHLAFEVRPDIAALAELVDDYERVAVALVSKDKARLFTVVAGAIEEKIAVEDFVPGKTDVGGWKKSKIQRHHEQHVLWHLKKVVTRLSQLKSRHNFDRLILMGPVEATSELQELLPHELKTCVAAVVPAEQHVTDAAILEKTIEVERRLEADAEDRLVSQVIDTAGPGGRATRGVDATLEALWVGDVRTLLIAAALQLAGTECSNCRRLHRGNSPTCQSCGAPARPLRDFVHQLEGRAVGQSARVEVVHGVAADRLKNAAEGLAAFLRFPQSPTI